MKRFFYLSLILLFTLSSCTPSTSEASTPTSPSTPQVVHAATPTATATPILKATPLPPPELTYVITLSEQQNDSIHIKLTAKNISNDRLILTFWTNAAYWEEWMNPLNNVSNISAISEGGRPLTTQLRDDGIRWTGQHGLMIDLDGQHGFILEYDVRLGFIDKNFHGDRPQLLGGYLTKSDGVAEPEFIFLAPNDIEKIVYKMQVIFDLPDEWQVATHWTKVKENEYEVSTEVGVGSYSSIEFADGAIAFGDIYKEEHIIGATTMSVAVLGYPDDVAKKLAALTVKNFEYYTTLLGATPTRGYIMAFVPPKMGGRYVNPVNENIGGCFTRIYVTDNLWNTSELWWTNISHPMFHNWTAYLPGEFWLSEGFTSYYELKALKVLGMNTDTEIDSELGRRLRRYQLEIVGTSNDYPLQEASAIYPNNHVFPFEFITYRKGSLFAYLLDQEITRRTNGEKTLDDVMHYLFQKEAYVDSQQLVDGIFSVTGEDFSQIIDDYLLDNKPLPLVRNGNSISVDVAKLTP